MGFIKFFKSKIINGFVILITSQVVFGNCLNDWPGSCDLNFIEFLENKELSYSEEKIKDTYDQLKIRTYKLPIYNNSTSDIDKNKYTKKPSPVLNNYVFYYSVLNTSDLKISMDQTRFLTTHNADPTNEIDMIVEGINSGKYVKYPTEEGYAPITENMVSNKFYSYEPRTNSVKINPAETYFFKLGDQSMLIVLL